SDPAGPSDSSTARNPSPSPERPTGSSPARNPSPNPGCPTDPCSGPGRLWLAGRTALSLGTCPDPAGRSGLWPGIGRDSADRLARSPAPDRAAPAAHWPGRGRGQRGGLPSPGGGRWLRPALQRPVVAGSGLPFGRPPTVV